MAARGHAVVIGASIAGLLAAQALSEAYAQVTVFDRDELPDEPRPRRGVPQSRQAHALHARGAEALGELFDGFWDDMTGAGGVSGDAQAAVHWYLDGYQLKPAVSGLTGIALTRPTLEQLIRARVAALPGVTITAGSDVTGLVTEAGRVTGVTVRAARGAAGPNGAGRTVIDETGPGDAPSDGHTSGGRTTDDRTSDNRTPDNRTPDNRTADNRTADDRTPGGRTPDGRTGDGLTAERRTADGVATVDADLVVDAAGRGSRAMTWLGDLGFPVPRTTELKAGVVYVSRHYSALPEQLGGRIGGLVTPYPGEPRAGVVLRQEGGKFVVLLAGMTGVEPPTDDAGMLAFADDLACPDISTVLRESTPLGEAVKMRYPASVRHHYEDLDRYLDGFLVLGDALCSFNPIYGQGITVAALEALELRRLIAGSAGDGLPRRFFRAAGKLVAEAWETSASGDLRFPEVEGKRPPGAGIINAYLAKYRAAASVDPVLGTTFLRVANMIDPPTKLLAPGHVLRVLRSARKGTRSVRHAMPRTAA